ncbi:hypothetical protein HB364_13495 [Pseudoflavitalea sp. X16]|uniref:hypothetical protein n=1 Tax=Paraflavitalea devenefica TaxID=2716334 RepID=UPI00141FD481|nr:hypothetical protein [Paraflavitalea devenefica]NII26103.1 hypothetical protein [Paraflavitalea devenefica]
MNDNFLQSGFEMDSPLSREIGAFVQTLADNKRLRFDLAAAKNDYPQMVAEGLIKKASYFSPGLEGTFTNDARIMHAFYTRFSAEYSFSLSADVAAIQAFVHQVGNYFHVHAPQGVSELSNSLVRYLLDNARKEYGLELSEYACSLERADNKEPFIEFFNAYLDIIGAGEGFASVWKVCSHFAVQLGPPLTHDMPWRNLGIFVNKLVDYYREQISEIRAIAEQEQTDPALKMLYLELLLKVCKEGALPVEEIVDWLDQENTQERAIRLLIPLKVSGEQLRQKLLTKLVGLKLSEELKISRLHLFLKMLVDSAEDAPAFKAQIIAEIAAHFQDPDITDLSVSLRLLSRCNAESEARYQILEGVLMGPQFKPEYLASCMDIFFIIHRDVKLCFQFMKAACLKLRSAKEIEQAFDSPIEMYRREVREDFEREAILLCIDSEGPCRLLGHGLLFSGFQLGKPASLTYDILQLDLLQQYKLVMILLTLFHPANHTVPVVSRLLNSPSGIVRELVACKFEELINSYQNEVITLVKAALPDTHPEKPALLARLEAALVELVKILDKKRSIKELDPMLAETEQMRAYSRAQMGVTRKAFKKSKAEHRGITSIVTPTQVARGGGTVLPDATVSSMMSASVSFTLPRTMFITPERKDYEMRLLFSSNWDKEFEEWEQIILSSGNI